MTPFINNQLTKTIALIVLFVTYIPLVHGKDLDYQNRGNRWEGIAPYPVTGSDVELVSALVNHRERWQPFPPNCKVKFYLQHATKVALTIQELRPKHFYKMDRIIPKQPWRQGFNNFQWSTDTVIAPLHLNIAKLGGVARLKPTTSRGEEYIAPVAFYHSSSPVNVNSYLFTFTVGSSAKLSYAVYQGNGQEPLIENDLGKQSVGIPFVVIWDSNKAPAGSYELIVNGYFLRDFGRIRKSVHFHHNPLLN